MSPVQLTCHLRLAPSWDRVHLQTHLFRSAGISLSPWGSEVDCDLAAFQSRQQKSAGRFCLQQLVRPAIQAFPQRVTLVGALSTCGFSSHTARPAPQAMSSAQAPQPHAGLRQVELTLGVPPDMPFLTCTFKPKPLVPGMPYLVDVTGRFDRPGIWSGRLTLSIRESGVFAIHEEQSIPVSAKAVARP